MKELLLSLCFLSDTLFQEWEKTKSQKHFDDMIKEIKAVLTEIERGKDGERG